MFPTLFFGTVLFGSACMFVANPERRRLRLSIVLAVLTMLSATLGFVTGMIRTTITAGQLEPHEQFGTVLIGFGESLHNIGLGLCLLIIAAIATAFGVARRRAMKAELVDV